MDYPGTRSHWRLEAGRSALVGVCSEKIDFRCLVFESAFDLVLNIAPTLRRSAVPVLRKQALARTPDLFSAYGLGHGAMFKTSPNALSIPLSSSGFSGLAPAKKSGA